jgi:hypothetical protein
MLLSRDIKSATAGTQSTLFASLTSPYEGTSHHGHHECYEPSLRYQHFSGRDRVDLCGVDEKEVDVHSSSTRNRHCGRSMIMVPANHERLCTI